MKIFYGVQGTGNGHIARARMMAKELYAQGLRSHFYLRDVARINILIWKSLGIINYERA